MMKYLASLATILSVALADWTVYCGSSCSDGTAVATGDTAVDTCTSLGGTYDYCYIESDETYWKAIAFENSGCSVNDDEDGYHESSGLFNGDCSDAGSWTAYEVVENL